MFLIQNFRRRPFTLLLGMAALLAATLFATGCAEQTQAGANTEPAALPVKVQVAKSQPVGDYTEYLATLKSRHASVLQPQVEGYITRILIRSGDQAQAGQPLLEIDPLKQQATVNNQEATRRLKLANLDWAKKELDRRRQLFSAGVISRQDLDQQESAFKAAEADVEAMEAGVREQNVQLRYYTVRAPAAGTIGDVPIRVGDRVTVQTVLTTLDRDGELEAYISVPAEKSALLRPGTAIEVLDEQSRPIARSTISFISPRVDPATQLLLLIAKLPNQDHRFRNEQVVHVRVVWRQAEHPLVPVTAVARITGQTFAFVAEDDKGRIVARQRSVRLGEISGNDYVVLEGLQPGDRIITTGVQMLVDGMPVKPGA